MSTFESSSAKKGDRRFRLYFRLMDVSVWGIAIGLPGRS